MNHSTSHSHFPKRPTDSFQDKSAEQIASALEGRKSGAGWICRCPAHADDSPSLSVTQAENGRVLVRCHAGCSQDSVISALTAKDLWPKREPRLESKREYVYTDFDGHPALRVTRTDLPSGGKKFFQSRMVEGQWVAGGVKSEILPYRMDLWKDEKSRGILLVEGEKCADALIERGFLATTTPGGSNGWRESFAKHFYDKNVVILPDNDDPGIKYAVSAYGDIKAHAKSVRILELEGLSPGEDIYDWFEKGHSAKDLKKILIQPSAVSERVKDALESRNSPALTQADDEIPIVPEAKEAWPAPLAKEALHGVMGEIVKAIEPHSEADVAALLIQLLTAFGNTIGRSAHFPVEADKQHLNLFSIVVGNSSRARKGTSLGHIKRIFEHLEPEYFKTRRLSGLSSGEGLIASVRDEVTITEEDEKSGQLKTRVVDQGVTDKRGLCIETEFASVLQALRRDGNKLSAIIRDCYDHGNLSAMTRKDPLKATDAHISIIAHITQPELRRYLNDVELLNGFANRFLWVVARRSKKLPMGGKFSLNEIKPQLHELSRAISFGRSTYALSFDEKSEVIWRDLYEQIGDERPGLFGSLTARAEANIIRIASIYAVLDLSSVVKEEHLIAAVALWDYIEASIRFIFGTSTGNKTADKILAALKESVNGLTQTEILHKVLKRNPDRQELAEALLVLKESDLAQSSVETNASGRKVTIWRATKKA